MTSTEHGTHVPISSRAREERDGKEPTVDFGPLSGFSFACRPDCGLCCYATPAVSAEESARLLQIEPSTPFLEGQGGYSLIASRPEGGACHFLKANRCRCHPDRPFPCREYPLTAHVGTRVQVTTCLSCPGVDLSRLALWNRADGAHSPAVGFQEEIAAITAETLKHPVGVWIEFNSRRVAKLRMRMQRHELWSEPDELRARLLAELPLPGSDDFPPGSPPTEEEGLATLPLFYEKDRGCVSFYAREEGWAAFVLRETGGKGDSLGVFAPPDTPPSLTPQAEQLLRGYLAYLVRRDQLLWAVYYETAHHPDASLEELAEAFLLEAGTQVMARAFFRARMNGLTGKRLEVEDLERGIRATDSDLLDLPTYGRVL